MKTLLIFIFGAAYLAASQRAVADEKAQADTATREIPLKDVWAYEMPGTRSVKELEQDNFGEGVKRLGSDEQNKRYKDSLTFRITEHLGAKFGKPAEPGFVTTGSGIDALRGAASVLADGNKPSRTFPSQSRLSLIFYSTLFECYVRLESIKLSGKTITIEYFFVPHREQELTSEFAIIPLGQLTPGKWKVETVRIPMPNVSGIQGVQPPPQMIESKVVCTPFDFNVEESEK